MPYLTTLMRLPLAALLSFATLTAAAAPRDPAPLSAEAVAAVRAAQQGRADPMAETLDRHLREGLELTERSARAAAGLKGLKASEIQATLTRRQTPGVAEPAE